MNKLEIYGIIAGVWLLTCAGAYGWGRLDLAHAYEVKQLEADRSALQAGLDHAADLTAKDNAARATTQTLLDNVNRGIANVQTKFAGLPNVVVDPNGCAHLAESFRLRWNQIETVPGGAGTGAVHGPDGPVPREPLPPAR